MKKLSNIITYIILMFCAVTVVSPIIYILISSVSDGSGNVGVFDGYKEVFVLTPNYLIKFWNSMLISSMITAGQVVLSCLGGYGFAKFKFPLKNVLFYFIIILMMMPLQVTLVPNYIVLDKMQLIGSYTGLILTGICSTFGVFLMTQVFSSVPNSIIEAAKLDGANQLQILLKIVIPYSKNGIASLVILNFIDNWNMVEQPLVFLKDRMKYPLSVFLTGINGDVGSTLFVCSVMTMVPVFFLFMYLKDMMIFGIETGNLQ
mgnify:CR=1 FL=1